MFRVSELDTAVSSDSLRNWQCHTGWQKRHRPSQVDIFSGSTFLWRSCWWVCVLFLECEDPIMPQRFGPTRMGDDPNIFHPSEMVWLESCELMTIHIDVISRQRMNQWIMDRDRVVDSLVDSCMLPCLLEIVTCVVVCCHWNLHVRCLNFWCLGPVLLPQSVPLNPPGSLKVALGTARMGDPKGRKSIKILFAVFVCHCFF